MANRFNLPRVSVFDGNGDPLNGATLTFYQSGTSTPLDTYSDADLTTANTNPVVADSSGRFGNIFLKNQLYKVVLKTSADVEVWSADPVNSETVTPGVTAKTAGFTVTGNDDGETFAVDASGGAVTVALPAVADIDEGFTVSVKKTDSSANAVTIDPDGTETVDGAASLNLDTENEGITIVSDGSKWLALFRLRPTATDEETREMTSATAAVTPANLAARTCFFAHKNSTDQTGIASATNTKLTFGTADFNVGEYYDTTTGKFTPPAGKYRLSACALFTVNVVDQEQYRAVIYKNGSLLRQNISIGSGTTNITAEISCIVDANGTDEFEIYVYGSGTGNKTVSGNSANTWFCGEAI